VSFRRPLHWFAILTALATLTLVVIGGLVTSHGVGMSVPDWPTTYGYNMFFFPISQWTGGIFYEHTHRLVASGVGLLVVVLTRWLGGRPSRLPLAVIGLAELLAGFALLQLGGSWKGTGYFLSGIGGLVLLAGVVWTHNAPAPGTLPQLGWLAFVSVQIQGLLGGLRVVLFKDEIGIFHATLAQLFFVLTCAIALLTSRWWQNRAARRDNPAMTQASRIASGLQPIFLLVTFLILGQLILGATMRHQHAGLAIPDFPLAYGQLWPATDSISVTLYNQHRVEITNVNPITAFQVILQMAHRIVAFLILWAVAFSAWTTRRGLGGKHTVSRLALAWFGLICAQILLGAATIWSNKAADLATGHVFVGSLSLALGACLCVIIRLDSAPVRQAAKPAAAFDSPAPFGPRPSSVPNL
jgi:cytochrome c oxidase assembly protein subunit 15